MTSLITLTIDNSIHICFMLEAELRVKVNFIKNQENVSTNVVSPKQSNSSTISSDTFLSMASGQTGEWGVYRNATEIMEMDADDVEDIDQSDTGVTDDESISKTCNKQNSSEPNILFLLDHILPLKKKEDGWKPDRTQKVSIELLGFKLGETIGKGPYSKIKLAKCPKSNRMVAVKIIKKKIAPKEYVDKFLCREITAMQRLEHPNIIQLYQAVETRELMYLVMEHAPNKDLLEYINETGHLCEEEARRILRQILDAILYMHSQGVIHRDIKCDNVLLDEDYNVKLSDFGFSRLATESNIFTTHCGSYTYVAPEVLEGGEYDGVKAEIWSLGVCLYGMVCGKLPFHEEDRTTLNTSMHEKIRFYLDISLDCRKLIKSMLHIEPDKRITITEVIKSPWMSKPMQNTHMLDLKSCSKLNVCNHASSQISNHVITPEGIQKDIEHGFSCDQHNFDVKPRLVTDVLQSVAVRHSTGQSEISLDELKTAVGRPLGRVPSIMGLVGPAAKSIYNKLTFIQGPGKINRKRKTLKNKLSQHEQDAALFRKLSQNFESHDSQHHASSHSFINLPFSTALNSVILDREKTVEKELHDIKYGTASKVSVYAKKCQQQEVAAKKVNQAMDEAFDIKVQVSNLQKVQASQLAKCSPLQKWRAKVHMMIAASKLRRLAGLDPLTKKKVDSLKSHCAHLLEMK